MEEWTKDSFIYLLEEEWEKLVKNKCHSSN